MKSLIFLMMYFAFMSNTSFAQSLTWDLENEDSTITAGSFVDFKGHLTTDNSQVFNCIARAENINLPADWYYVICNPFSCLMNNMPSTSFAFPDIVNNDWNNNGFGGSLVKIGIHSTAGNTVQVGELDFVLENTSTNEIFTRHLIVRTNGQSLGLQSESNETMVLFPNPVNDQLTISNCEPTTPYVIVDLAGRELGTGFTNGVIDCSTLLPGNYLLQLALVNGEQTFLPFQKN